MANVNLHRKGIGAKFAYYGPPGSGKSTNLEFLNRLTANPAELMSVPHPEGRTVAFFLPVAPNLVHGVELRVRVVTVQTRLEKDKAWQQALRECDGVVFVADSRRGAVETNKRYVQLLAEDLRAVGISPTGIPILLQLNWQDAPDALKPEEASQAFNAGKWPAIAAVASQGIGVVDTAAAAFRMVCKHLQKHYAELGGAGELADRVHVHLATAAAPAPVPTAADGTELPEVDEEIVVDADEPAAAVIVEPKRLGVTPPPLPTAASGEKAGTPARPANVVAAADAQAGLAALGHVRQRAADLQALLEAGAALGGRISGAADQVNLLRDAAAEVGAQIARLAAEQAEQAAAAPAALQEIPARLAEVELLLGQYRERVASLEQALADAESASAAKQAALEAQLEAAKAVSAQLTEIDKELEANLAKARDEVEAARNDLAVLRTAAEESGAEVARLKGELAEALDRAAQAEQAKAAAEQAATAAQGQLETEASVLKGELGKLMEEAEAARQQAAQSEQARAEAVQQLGLAVNAGEALQGQVAALSAELEIQKSAAEGLRAEAANAQQQADQMAAHLAEIQAAAQQQAEQLMAQLAEARAAAEIAGQQSQASASSGAEVEELRHKVATLEEVIEGLRNYQALALRLQQEVKEKDARIAELGGGQASGSAAPAKTSRPSGPSGAKPATPVPGTDPFAADPNHQLARRLAKGLITEFAARFLPAISDAVGKGVFDQAFETQVRGMRKAYDSRVLPQVREVRDYLQDELDALVAEIRKAPK